MTRRRLVIAFLALAGQACGGGRHHGAAGETVEEAPVAPKIRATPPAGTYDSYTLDVRLEADAPGAQLIVARNHKPIENDAAWVTGPVVTRLEESGTIRVLTRDAAGNVFGPTSFVYRLAERNNTASCRIENVTRFYYGPGEPLVFDVVYALQSALSKVELLVDGKAVDDFSSASTPYGTTRLTAGALGVEGAYEVACRISSPLYADVFGTSLTVHVDATPPVLHWDFAGAWRPPTHFAVAAEDAGGAGVALAELCNAGQTLCVPMREITAGRYGFATAFTAVGTAGFTLTARAVDGAGNVGSLAAVTYGAADIPSTAPPALLPVTLTTATAFDLQSLVAGLGLPPAAEAADLHGAPVTAAALPLGPGWNEFIFRATAAPRWESFAIYRAGLRVALPAAGAGGWLVYASSGTVPALAARRVDRLPGGATEYRLPQFRIPRVFFVADMGGDGAWDDADLVYFLDVTDAGGPWLRDGAPLDAGVSLWSPQAGAAQTAGFDCANCRPGGLLVLQRRQTPAGPLVGRQSLPGADVSAGPLASQAYQALAGERCLFFWDEDADGAPGGDEPRASGPCGASSYTLARGGALTAEVTETSLSVTGLPYGRAATAQVTVGAGAALLRGPWEPIFDFDGTGARSLPLLRYAAWPGALAVATPTATTTVTLLGAALGVTTTGQVEVRDENDAPLAAAVEADSPGVHDYAIYDGTTPAVLAYAAGSAPRLRALRDGYLGEWMVPGAAFATLRLRSPAATAVVSGHVRDEAGRPVTGAAVVWDAYPYAAQTVSDPLGAFSLPVLGTGALTVTRAEGGIGREVALSLNAGEARSLDLVVPRSADGYAGGLRGAYAADAVTGPSPVTLYVDPVFAWASPGPGAWTLTAPPNFSRAFTAPGALPLFDLADPVVHAVPWTDVLLESQLYLRCGARGQRIPFGAFALVDSPCWDVFADRAGATWFLGRADRLDGLPEVGLRRWYATLLLNGAAYASLPFQVRDLLFGRSFDGVTNADGRTTLVLPYGLYQVETSGGGVFKDAAGAPARIAITHLTPEDAIIHYP